MLCVSCGKDIEKNAKFCPYCGLAVPVIEKVKPVKKESVGTGMSEQPPSGTTKVSPKNTKIVLSIAIILIGLSGLIIFVLPKGNPKEIFNNNDWFAEEEIGEHEQTAPSDAETFLERGKMFDDRGDFETAIADFSEALSLDPNMAEAYRLRGRALIASASKTIAASDAGSNGGTSIGVVQGERVSTEQMQMYDKAIADLTQAIRLDPDNAKAYSFRGTAYLCKNDYDKAIADYNRAIQLDQNYAGAYSNRGNVYGIKGEYSRAISDFEVALRLEPNDTNTRQALEDARRSRGY
jgi:tetratricopeptide (TPR) repeat protein